MDNPVEEFESLKGTIDELKVKMIGDQREKERLEKELAGLKAEIKEAYGVEIEDFESAIAQLKNELAANLALLKEQIEDCKRKME